MGWFHWIAIVLSFIKRLKFVFQRWLNITITVNSIFYDCITSVLWFKIKQAIPFQGNNKKVITVCITMSYIHFKLETALQDKTGILSIHHLVSGLGREWSRGCSRGGGWGCCRSLWGDVHRASGPVGGRGGPRLSSYFRGAIRTGGGGGIWGDVLCRSGHFVRTAHKHWKWQHEFW